MVPQPGSDALAVGRLPDRSVLGDVSSESDREIYIEPLQAIASPNNPVDARRFASYRVRPGDTLWGLSRRYEIAPATLAAVNNLDANALLRIDQVLRIPVSTTALKDFPTVSATSALSPQVLPSPERSQSVEVASQLLNESQVLPPLANQDALALLPTLPLFAAPENAFGPTAPGLPISGASFTVAPTLLPAESPQLLEPEVAESVARSIAPAPITTADDTLAAQIVHRVRRGDTLYGIARRYGVLPNEILALNRLSNPNQLIVGRELRIPSRAIALNAAVAGGDRTWTAIQSPAVDSAPEQQTFHVNRLRADITRLRQEYRLHQVRIRESASAVEPKASGLSTPTSLVNLPTGPVAVAPVEINAYNRTLDTPVGRSVSPDLPPLSSPDEHLPDGADAFAGYIWPARGVLTSGYGMRWGRMHRGIDIAAPVGTPIFAASSGEVVVAGWNAGGYGNIVKLRHGDGSVTLYAHNSRIVVRRGQRVRQGQQIAEMGSTGRSSGPHLHFEIHPGGRGATNPITLLPRNK
ncbi:membrane protein [Rubidibacter lacunae KORDI 51-2]|uniref:Membrane protein n=1 Tax=Rubidibacter lacunae KORDI 51-2 TaxID=582515 RepID=U5DJW4_9CHRO|nr:LysM peptidoglycan-binding domain-containing M23 family metallopeptidase [Rubidibacter lacunae]ERN41192.1 membrane protein [Rubidibacter lacunae KORDI 51-2]